MDHFRSLYKNNFNSPKKCKRKEAYEIRANKRSELYSSTRNISPSPPSTDVDCNSKQGQKENIKPHICIFSEAETFNEPTLSLSSSSKQNTKLSRQKAHVLKFLAWKREKARQAQIKEKSKRAPFVVGARSCVLQESVKNSNIRKPSFAPVNHIFSPPAPIQNIDLKVIDSNSLRLLNGNREEIYHFLATPKKYNQPETDAVQTFKKSTQGPKATIVKSVPEKSVSSAKAMRMVSNCKISTNIQELPQNRKVSPAILKPKTVLPPIKRSTFKAPKKSNSSISKALMAVTGNGNLKDEGLKVKLNGESVVKKLIESEALSKHITVARKNGDCNVVNSITKKPISSKESISILPLVEIEKLKTRAMERKAHATEKDSKAMPFTRGVITANTPVLKPVSSSKFKPGIKNSVQEHPFKSKAVSVKPKTILPSVKRSTFKAPKKSSSSISNAFMKVSGNKNIRNGPTKVKLNGKVEEPSADIPETPNDANQGHSFLNVVTSTKRKSLSSKESSANSLLIEMDELVSPVEDGTAHGRDTEKFNFLRYSVVQQESTDSKNDKPKITEAEHATPENVNKQHTSTTYLSPYVSVSRGKVGIKIEREKRNSVYMPMDKSNTEDADVTAKARHTMATVHYYRNQLKDEIDRLNAQCETWQQYKEANKHLVDDTGSDMINVTIGQTKLLTTKKLKQFGDLIDRCEDGAMGKLPVGKGEGAKPILTEDLEGFWSMVGLQIENVDKRFANLQRWKENNWKDPDEVPTKLSSSKNNLKKKKAKAGSKVAPNRDLQKILRNAQTAFLRKKMTNSGFDEDVILTPSKTRQVLIRDRRSRSAAATVITVNTPRVNRKSSIEQTTPTRVMSDNLVLPHIHGFRKSMNLFKNTLLNVQEMKSPRNNNCATPLPPSRKSILKTPGSIRQLKSVIFNTPPLQFTVEDKVENESVDSKKEVEEERTYSLRTRSIKLRDLADIIIPE